MTVDEIRSVATRSLQEVLGPYGFERVDVEIAPDHDGEAALFMIAHFAPDAAGERPLARAMGALRDALLDKGEERLPYLRSAFPNETILADDEATTH